MAQLQQHVQEDLGELRGEVARSRESALRLILPKAETSELRAASSQLNEDVLSLSARLSAVGAAVEALETKADRSELYAVK